MASNEFFKEQQEHSLIKALIVQKYFWSWASIMLGKARADRICYIDLFAGPGRYHNGAKSTPLLVLESAIQDKNPRMRESLVTVFNDKDEANVKPLQLAISQIPGINTLKYQPQVMNNEVGTEIVAHFESVRMVPTLFFVDPFGYKGLSLRLVNAVLKNWGSDCIFFFNYNRINMGVGNDAVLEHMEALFGPTVISILRPKLTGLSPADRELAVVDAVSQALVAMGGKFVLPFRFRDGHGNRTSHYLIFVSKHVLGYTIMKGIMGGESSSHAQGVPSFEFSPATRAQPLLFELARPLDDLGPLLLEHFFGRTLTTKEIFDQHHVGRPYILANYKAVLYDLEKAGKVTCEPSAAERRKIKGKPSFGDSVRVTFVANI
jgi:three-Cys-motif partner protein